MAAPASKPAARAALSVSPVPAAVASNTLTTLEPRAPAYRIDMPSALEAAILPCRFAGPASGTRTLRPDTLCTISFMSPAAQMCGSEVRRCSSTARPPHSPSASPAFRARASSGRTPTESRTRSAAIREPSDSSTSARRAHVPRRFPRGRRRDSPVRTRTPCDSQARGDQRRRTRGPSTDMTRGSSSTTVVAMPRAGEGLGHLQADEPAPGDHGRGGLLPLDELVDPVHVGHGPQAEHVRRIDPGNGGITGLPPWARIRAS